MYVHEDITITIRMQFRLSDPKTIKFRADLEFSQINLILNKTTISSNTTIKSIFCRKKKLQRKPLKTKD